MWHEYIRAQSDWCRAVVPALLGLLLCSPVGAGMVMRQVADPAPATQPTDSKPQIDTRPVATSASPSVSRAHRAQRPNWPPCIRLLNESALAPALMPEQRQALLEHCAS